jgi:uncharacterized membrane protein YgcG
MFAPRRKHADSRSFFDGKRFFRETAFENDWALAHPERCRLWRALREERDREALKASMRERYRRLMEVFAHRCLPSVPHSSRQLLWTMNLQAFHGAREPDGEGALVPARRGGGRRSERVLARSGRRRSGGGGGSPGRGSPGRGGSPGGGRSVRSARCGPGRATFLGAER